MPGTCERCHAALTTDALFCAQCGQAIRLPRFGVPHRTRRPHLSRGGVLPDETILWTGHIAFRALLPQMLLAALAAVAWYWLAPADNTTALTRGWIGIAMGLVAYLAYRRWDESFILTNRRLVHEVGIFSRTTNFLEAIDIDDVGIEQSLWDRLLGIGTITIESTDNSDPWLEIRGVFPAPEIASLIDATRHRERVARGMHVEMI